MNKKEIVKNLYNHFKNGQAGSFCNGYVGAYHVIFLETAGSGVYSRITNDEVLVELWDKAKEAAEEGNLKFLEDNVEELYKLASSLYKIEAYKTFAYDMEALEAKWVAIGCEDGELVADADWI